MKSEQNKSEQNQQLEKDDISSSGYSSDEEFKRFGENFSDTLKIVYWLKSNGISSKQDYLLLGEEEKNEIKSEIKEAGGEHLLKRIIDENLFEYNKIDASLQASNAIEVLFSKHFKLKAELEIDGVKVFQIPGSNV